MTGSFDNKRQHKRVEDIFAVTYQLRDSIDVAINTGGKDFTGVAVDISEGGLGVELAQKLPVGVSIHLNFTIINTMASSDIKRKQRIFELNGQIRHCVKTPKNTYRAGVMFTNISPDETRFIADFVRVQMLLKSSPSQ